MPRKLNEIELWFPNRNYGFPSGVYPYPSDLPPIINQLSRDPEITYRVGDPATVRLSFEATSDVARLADSNSGRPFFSRNRILRLKYDDASFQEYRITDFRRDLTGSSDAVVTGERLTELFMSESIIARKRDPSFFQLSIVFHRIPMQGLMDELFSVNYNTPELIIQGDIQSDLQNIQVSIQISGQNYMDLVQEACRQVDAEWEFRYVPAEDKYALDIVRKAGRQTGEDNRVISSLENRQDITQEDYGSDIYSAAAVISGDKDQFGIMGDAFWRVIYVNYNSLPDSTEIALDDATKAVQPGMLQPTRLTPPYLKKGSSIWEIEFTASSPIDINGESHWRIRIPGDQTSNIGVDDRVQFARNAGGNLIYGLTSTGLQQVYGFIEKIFYRNDISPFNNIPERFGITIDLSSWGTPTAGFPDKWSSTSGPETVEEITNPDYVRYGTKSAKVTLPSAGSQFRTYEMDLSNTQASSPYYSIWAAIRVESGSVRLQLRDSESTTHPPINDAAQTNVDNIVSISVGGMQPVIGSGVRVEFVALEDNTVFYVDAITFTNSTHPVELAANMGPQAMFWEAVRLLSIPKIRDERDYTISFYDPAHYDSAADEIQIGDLITLKDSYNTNTNNFEIDKTLRVVELTEWESQIEARPFKRARLSTRTTGIGGEIDERYIKRSEPTRQFSVPVATAKQLED